MIFFPHSRFRIFNKSLCNAALSMCWRGDKIKYFVHRHDHEAGQLAGTFTKPDVALPALIARPFLMRIIGEVCSQRNIVPASQQHRMRRRRIFDHGAANYSVHRD